LNKVYVLTLQYYHIWHAGGIVNEISLFCTFLLIMAAVIHQLKTESL